MEPGWKKTAVDIVGGIPLDPLTYVPFGRVAQAIAKPAAAGIKAIPGGAKALSTTRNAVADTMNWHQLTPDQRAIETAAKSAGSNAARASEVRAKQILEGLERPEREAIFEAIQNVDKQGNLLSKPRMQGWWSLADNQADAVASLQAHPSYAAAIPARKAAMEQAAKDAVELSQTQFDEALTAVPTGQSQGPYAKRIFKFGDKASAAKAKSLTSDVDLAAAIKADPAIAKAYSTDLSESLMTRAGEQGKFATRKALGDEVMKLMGAGKPFDPTQDAGKVGAYLDDLIKANGPERDFAVRAKGLFSGIGKMNPLNEALAKFNSNVFKPAATVGVVIPRVSFSARNSISSIVQALSTPGARGAALKDPKWIAQRAYGAFLDPIDEAVSLATKGQKRLITDDTNLLLKNLNEAFDQSRGSLEKTKDFLRKRNGPMDKEAVQALEQNVLENPVRVDEVMTELAPDAGFWKKAKNNVWDLPAKLNKHMEDRIRAGLFVAAKRAGQSDAAASASVRNAVLDYSVPTIENRVMRTWVPFGAFMSQTLPQSVKLLGENVIEGGIAGGIAGGAARGAANQMFETDPENPVYPDMVGKMTVNVGEDDKGDPQYLTSLGLPIEGLGDLPLGTGQRDLERFIGVAMNPLAKSAYSAVSGRDPFFGTAYGGYDKPPAAMAALGMESGPLASKVRKAMGTGVVQPLTHALNLAEPWLDDRQGTGMDLIRALTGVRVRSVDENQALKLNLEESLRSNPQVKQYSGFYKGSDDPETNDLMAEYNEVKKRIKAKKEAANVQ
jgi:hypothetical protein